MGTGFRRPPEGPAGGAAAEGSRQGDTEVRADRETDGETRKSITDASVKSQTQTYSRLISCASSQATFISKVLYAEEID